MKHALLGALSTLLLPFSAHAAASSAGGYLMRGGYQPRSYLRVGHGDGNAATTLPLGKAVSRKPRPEASVAASALAIQQHAGISELVVIDSSVQDKATLYRGLNPGVGVVEIDANRPGLPQLVQALQGYKDLAAIHVVSHASPGALQLGSSRITAESVHAELDAMQALRAAVREGADLLFYGCDLAANGDGEELLDIVRSHTGMDVAASSNLTGALALGGDWELEVRRGDVESALAFSEKSLKDFASVLVASNGIKDFNGTVWSGQGTQTGSSTDFRISFKPGGTFGIYNYSGSSYAYTPNAVGATGNYFYVKADGTNTTAFELTEVKAFEAPAANSGRVTEFTNVRVVGYLQTGGTVNSAVINGTASQDTFVFAGSALSAFAGKKLQGFKLHYDCSTACDRSIPNDEPAFFSFQSFSIAGAVNLPPPPSVSPASISISGASGTSGAYRIGDTVTATWNNTAVGDNNASVTGVTVDFSQFGGGAAVAATNSSGIWTAMYTLTAGAIDTANRNVRVTATNNGGPTTTADSTNATVDNIAPTVTDGRINISGASGTGGAYKIGDTVTATWNNTAGGDDNADTISNVTVDFSQFGGGAVAASNSSGTWTATYTIVAGAIDATNRNITVTATDNAGNTTATADTTNATVDNIAPTVSITPAGGAVSSDTTVDFTVDFSEAVSNVSTDDFTRVVTGSAAGTIASVSASSGDLVTVTVGAISGSGTLKLNLNGSTNIVDDAGNSIAAYSSGTPHAVSILTAPDAPTIGAATAGDGQVSVAFSAPASNGGSAITGYTVTSSPGGITGGGNGFTTSPITVTGLTNGTAYTFTVTAANAIGSSTASGASGSATPKADQTITFAQPIAQDFGTTPTLSGTSTSGLTVMFSSSTTGVCTITSGGVLTFFTAGSCTIDADQAGNASTNAALTVSRTFPVNAVVPGAPTIGTATAGDRQADVAFTAPASNGGATITGYTVTSNLGGFVGTGAGSPIKVSGLTNGVSYTFTVTATNSVGTGGASGASNSITPASPQVITFANPGAQSFGTSPDLGAGVSSSSGLTVAFTSSTTGVCTITSAGVLTFVSTGTCTVNANQAGDSSYLPAPQVTRSFTVNPANQTITFTNPGAQNFGASPTLPASSTSGLTVTFSSSTTGVCTITPGGVLTFVTAGSCTIDADQAGDATTNAAMTVSRTFSVNAVVPKAPTIGTAIMGDTQADVTFTAPASNGGATITSYTVTANPGGATGTGAGSPLTVTGLTNGVNYTFTVTATNIAGTGAASAASNSGAPAAPQAITFANPGTQNFGTSPDLSVLGGGASSTSGLTVTFTSSTTGVCTITSGGVLTFISAGTCTLNANQAGNSTYLPAPQVTRSFTVSPVTPAAPTIGRATAGDTEVGVSFVAPVNTGGTTITGYTVTVSPADVAPVNGAGSPIVVTGLTNGQAYTFTVTADNSAGTGTASSASNSVTPKATQTITFNNPGAQDFGTTPTFSATADSGLTPTFTSSTTGVCTITGVGVVTFVTAGTCTINADQAGNGSYLAATQVTRNFTVNAVVPEAPTIGTATVAGAGEVAVAFTAPASNGGAVITGYTVTSNPGGIAISGTASPIRISGLDTGSSYTFTVTATNSAGTGSPSAASNSITTAVTQVITFANPGAQDFGTTPRLIASVDSGLPLRFVASTPEVCVVTADGLLSFTSAGTCTVTVHQDGDASHQMASLTQSFSVSAQVPATPVQGAVTVVGSGEVEVAFTPSAATGEAITYVVTAQPGGITASGTGSPIKVTGLTDGVSYTFTVSASGQAGDSTPSAPTAPVVPQVLQEVTFDAVATQQFDQVPVLSARADSGLPVMFNSQTPEVCTVTTDGLLTFVQAGSCTLVAGQAGDTTHRPASATRTFQIEPVPPGEPQIQTLTQVGTGQVSVAFTPPVFTGGAAIDGYRVTATPQGTAAPAIRAMSLRAAGTPGVITTTGSGSPIVVQGLAEGVTYVFTVAAYNLAGEGESDSAQELITAPSLSWVGDLQKVYGEADFELPLPQSNSAGAFTFSSSNTAVATVTGRTVTLVGAGTTTLSATQQAHGSYTAGTVEVELTVSERPDPTLDAEVRGGVQAQVDASVRFARVQLGNIQARLQQVRSGDNPSSAALTLAYAGDLLGQGMSVPVKLPMNAWSGLPAGWGGWMSGTATFGDSGRQAGGDFDFHTDGISLGVDRAWGDNALMGMATSIGRNRSRFDHSPSRMDADQYSLALYGLWRSGEHLFVDGALAHGWLDFDMARWNDVAGKAAAGQRDGRQTFGALTFGYQQQRDRFSLAGYGRFDGSRTRLDGYREHGLGVYDLDYAVQTVSNSGLALGFDGSWSWRGERVDLRPFWKLEYRQSLSNSGDARINYVQQPIAGGYVMDMNSYADNMLTLGAGFDVQTRNGWLVSLLFGRDQGSNSASSNSVGLRVSYGKGGAGAMGIEGYGADGMADDCQGRRCRNRQMPGMARP